MRIFGRVPKAILAAAIGALGTALAVGALGALGSEGSGKSGDDLLIRQSLAPSQPTDPTFHGVGPGGSPWVLKRGEARLERDGKLELRVRGLVIPVAPANGTPGGVNTISASLFCGADSDTAAVDTSKDVPISRDGDARIRDRSFTVPSRCLAPIILVHPNGDMSRYIAAGGWSL